MHVEHFMTKEPVACDANEPLQGVARLMRDKRVGCVVVQRGGKVAGIVTDRMLAVGALADGMGAETPVEDVMHADPVCCSLDDNLFTVVEAMKKAGVVRRIPIVDNNKALVGVVSISDVAAVAKDLVEAIMLEETHHAMDDVKVPTGAKRITGEMHTPAAGGSSRKGSR